MESRPQAFPCYLFTNMQIIDFNHPLFIPYFILFSQSFSPCNKNRPASVKAIPIAASYVSKFPMGFNFIREPLKLMKKVPVTATRNTLSCLRFVPISLWEQLPAFSP